ncbi:MAG TPA: ATP-binding cassette domain-containing protein [Marinagarivorans sp.]
MIRVEHIEKRFGATTAVRDVSFEANAGQTLGLLGPNGAGKTSSLRILCGLLKPDAGRVHIDAIDVVKSPVEAQKKLGVLPDNCGLYTRLTAAENLRYFAELYGLSRNRTQQRMAQLSRQLDMDEILHRKTQGFSQGERMKVALARALMHEPPYLILDEPTNGLDVLTTRAVRSLLLELKRNGTCLIFSSHLMHEVSHLCDQLTVITHGQVSAHGTPEDIIRQTGGTDLEAAFAQLCTSASPHSPEHDKAKTP